MESMNPFFFPPSRILRRRIRRRRLRSELRALLVEAIPRCGRLRQCGGTGRLRRIAAPTAWRNRLRRSPARGRAEVDEHQLRNERSVERLQMRFSAHAHCQQAAASGACCSVGGSGFGSSGVGG